MENIKNHAKYWAENDTRDKDLEDVPSIEKIQNEDNFFNSEYVKEHFTMWVENEINTEENLEYFLDEYKKEYLKLNR